MNRFPGKRREKAFFPCLSLLHSGRRFQFGVAEMGAVFFYMACELFCHVFCTVMRVDAGSQT